MRKCLACDSIVDLPFVCAYCGGSYCAQHRLPENHGCPNLKKATTPVQLERIEITYGYKPVSPLSNRILGAFQKSEFRQLVVAWLTLGFCFSVGSLLTPTLFPIMFAISLITLGTGFIFHELSHRFVARRFGCWAEFRLWPWGLALAVLLAVLSQGRLIFAAPGAVYIVPRSFGWSYGITPKQNALISLSGPLANIAVALFFALSTGTLGLIGEIGYRINLWLAAFNLLPFGQMDGHKIMIWKPIIWATVTIPVWLLVFLPLI